MPKVGDERFCFTWGLGNLGDTGFVPLYGFMLRTYAQLGLSRREMLCIIHLASYHYNSPAGESRPSLGRIADQMGYAHKQRIGEIVAGLEQRGMLLVTRRPGHTSIYNAYPFARAAYSLWIEEEAQKQEGDRVTPQSDTPGEGITPQSDPKTVRVTPQSNTVSLWGVPEEYKEGTKGREEDQSLVPLSEQEEKVDVWSQVLDELKLQMTTQTFNHWLKGSTCRAVNGHWTITVANPFAVEWVADRLKPKIEKAVLRHAEGVVIEFRAKEAG